jgi:tRNA A37 threonylcarbamoyladenosine modification protein TsaB
MLGELAERASKLFGRFAPRLRSLLLRLLPEESSLNLPASTMAVIAFAVPVVVVLIVSLVYLQVGRGQLYTNYMQQAQSAAASAEAVEDATEARQAWELTLYYAGQAEPYQEADEATTLRVQAQEALDELDYVERLDFQLALFGPLPENAEITRMVATSTDLYMLNQTDGSVIRAFLTSGGYQIDEGFDCGPGPYGGYIVSALIDLALLPRENPQNAALVAMDANGNLIYCVVDGRPLATPLTPPDSHWGRPTAITVADENLYVLDPLTNAVWIYFGEDFAFVDEPRFFFAQEVPTLSNGLDFAVQQGELYVLGLDGQIAYCEYSGDLENPTTCTDPLDYSDTRPGRSGGPSLEGAHFLQLQVTAPPEPSVYLADAVNGAIYQFSLRLNLVRQFRSNNPLPEAVVSAFTVSPNRALFLAFDNQIYIGFLP